MIVWWLKDPTLAQLLSVQVMAYFLVPKTQKCARDRAFSVAAPHLWNKLSIYIRRAPNVDTIKALVKTYLFKFFYVGLLLFVYILFSNSALQPLEKALYKCRLSFINTSTFLLTHPRSPASLPHPHTQNGYLWKPVIFTKTHSIPSPCLFIWIGTKLDWVSFRRNNRFSRYPFCFIIRLYFCSFYVLNVISKCVRIENQNIVHKLSIIAMKTKTWLSQKGLKWSN